ncbi:MAG TPA: metallophosphoesterase [Fimbriimonadaceae bacterium]|nr:metallophosphoesterase [Fimbriimonadaceae bacterium]
MVVALVLAAVLGQSPSKFRFVLYGDCRDGHTMHRKLVALILKQNPAFVIQTGDLVADGSNASQWKTYDDITLAMRQRVPLYPAPGNHDYGGSFYRDRINIPPQYGNAEHYFFNDGRWHFISLSVDLHMPYGPGTEQYNWLVADLKEAQAAKKDIAVFFHVPPYSIGGHGSDLKVRAALCPLFKKYGVSLVMNGHDHLYYRTIRDGITYVVSGGGGAPLYPALPGTGNIPGDKWLAANHIVVLDADGDHLHAVALKPDGSKFDTFDVNGHR